MPLHIIIVGGEISEYAQTYARESLSTLINDLEDQAITIEFDIIDWDVCDKFSNTDLIQQLTLKSQNCSGKLLMLANFSGFLEREKKWKDAQGQFDELFRYSRGNNSIALWIEPEKNNVIKEGGFFSRLLQWFEKQFSKIIGKKQKIECSSVKVSHPLGKGEFRTNLAVIRFDLPLRSKV
jgi:hypothetical protein